MSQDAFISFQEKIQYTFKQLKLKERQKDIKMYIKLDLMLQRCQVFQTIKLKNQYRDIIENPLYPN